MSPEEKEIGTGLVDIGGGTTDLAIFSGNNINISQLPRGIYIMNIMMADKQIVRKKIAVL
jgi:actin-like ATPase involved in cell morphogenesis